MRNTLICTVGTSLMGKLANPSDSRFAGILEKRDPALLAHALMGIDPSDFAAGAEINSIAGIADRGLLGERLYLYLLVSDTADGAFIGQALNRYFERPGDPLSFQKVEARTVSGLTHESPTRFRTEGLRNLVREIAEIVRCHNAHYVLINATGGYKAQISFAGLIGQALEIPVCYLFEKFSEVIDLPPMPVSLDMGFWLENAPAFLELAGDGLDHDPTVKEPRFGGLIELVGRDGEDELFTLSATGQLFHETFQRQFKQRRTDLLPTECGIAPEEKVIKFEDKNHGKHKGLKGYLRNLCHRPYVVRIFTHYYNPDLPLKNTFRPSAKGDIAQIEGIYSDGRATTKFDVVTTAESEEQQRAVVVDLLNYR